ncbi:UNVERIFIED_CONTAM: rRNA-binding ribosome biosynthesis protein utp25 [Siphonaria sp. JEL0065]|nr:rRNA-binding ribosome biosynthesis protein utp25 [Siphonaria sp. JEL0065]
MVLKKKAGISTLRKAKAKAIKTKERDLTVVERVSKKGTETEKEEQLKKGINTFNKHFCNDRPLDPHAAANKVCSSKVQSALLGAVAVFGEPLSDVTDSSITHTLEHQHVKERLVPLVARLVAEASEPADLNPEEAPPPRKRKLAAVIDSSATLPPIANALFPLLNSYKDILACSESLNAKNDENQVRLAYVMHAVNHVFKSRDRVLKNTLKLNRVEEKERLSKSKAKKDAIAAAAGIVADDDDANEEEDEYEEMDDDDDSEDDDEDNNNNSKKQSNNTDDTSTPEYRDQGFTRPKILILLPVKNIAFDVISLILKLSGASQIENKSRFTQEFTVPPEEDGIDPSKPSDFQHDFRGNIDDCFRIGIKFSRRHLKLFSDFYSADIIVASPLGLRMVVGAEGDRERDFDYLSSIEMVIVDRCDMLLMQNWDHVQHLFNHLNVIPKSAHDCDFARIKSWYLDGRSALFRQNIILSHFNAPEINALIAKQAKNIDGRIKISSPYPGTIGEVVVQVPQMFTKFQCTSLQTHDDDRFKHFCGKLIPIMRRNGFDEKGTMIVVPSYLDFVRVRNYLKDQRIEFGELCEYTPQSDISRNRSNFFHKKLSLLLMTERFHYFRRYKVRGVKSLIFYQLPEYAHFYPEILNTVEKGMDSSCQVVYSLYDKLRLERVVGTARVPKMLEKDTFMFA